jgi:DNA processing protein
MHKSCIGIVGARNTSHNGRKFTESIAQALGEAGQTVVSGMARGIDTAAHSGALDTGTIAVVAGGIDIIYPQENTGLYEQICERGLVIAENPMGVSPRAQDFPRRNRIVSGLSSGVVVVEAAQRSGSLITARLAAEQGRDVYAVPGHPLDPRAEGPNALIRDGAVLVRGANDILESTGSYTGRGMSDGAVRAFREDKDPDSAVDMLDDPDFDDARKTILGGLSYTPCDIDELIRESAMPPFMAQTVLIELEIAGRLQRLPGNRVQLISES